MHSPTGGNWGPFRKSEQESLADIVTALQGLAAASGGVPMYSGSGDPNGVITASPPAIYYDLTDITAPIQYIKSSGTNTNTGWV